MAGTKTQKYNPKQTSWIKIREAILKIEAEAFPQYTPQEEILESDFTNHENTVLLLRSSRGSIIGYAYAEPIGNNDMRRKNDTETAYMPSIAIHPKFQGKGLARDLQVSLEKQLKRQGYSFLEGHVINEKYFRSLQKIYADRIVRKRRTVTKKEIEHFIRIRLD